MTTPLNDGHERGRERLSGQWTPTFLHDAREAPDMGGEALALCPGMPTPIHAHLCWNSQHSLPETGNMASGYFRSNHSM